MMQTIKFQFDCTYHTNNGKDDYDSKHKVGFVCMSVDIRMSRLEESQYQ